MSVRTGRWEWGQYAHRSSAGSPTADIQGRRVRRTSPGSDVSVRRLGLSGVSVRRTSPGSDVSARRRWRGGCVRCSNT